MIITLKYDFKNPPRAHEREGKGGKDGVGLKSGLLGDL